MKLLLERWNKYLKESDYENRQLTLPGLIDKESPRFEKLLPEQEAALKYAFNYLKPEEIFDTLGKYAFRFGVERVADPYSVIKSPILARGSSLNDHRPYDASYTPTGLYLTEKELEDLNLTRNGELSTNQYKNRYGEVALGVFQDLNDGWTEYDSDALRQIRVKYVNRILQIAGEKINNRIQAWFSPESGGLYRLNIKYERGQ